MNRTKRDALAALAGAVAALTFATSLGCQGVNTRNDPALVEASDQFVNKTVGPEYEAYVMNDPDLGEPGVTTADREDRLRNVRSFRQAVQQAKDEIAETESKAGG